MGDDLDALDAAARTACTLTSHMLTRRPTDIGGGPLPDDFEIREDGQTVGRIYKAVNVTSRPWVWFLTAQGVQAKNGAADTLEEALEAFKAVWEQQPITRRHNQ